MTPGANHDTPVTEPAKRCRPKNRLWSHEFVAAGDGTGLPGCAFGEICSCLWATMDWQNATAC